MTDVATVTNWINTEFQKIIGRPADRYIAKSLITLAKTYPNDPGMVLAQVQAALSPNMRINEPIYNFVLTVCKMVPDIVEYEPPKVKIHATWRDFQNKVVQVEKILVPYTSKDGTVLTRGYLVNKLSSMTPDQLDEFLAQVANDEWLSNLILYDKYKVFDEGQTFCIFLMIASLHIERGLNYLSQKDLAAAEKEYEKALLHVKDIPVESGLHTVVETRRVIDRNMYQLYTQKGDNKKAVSHYKNSLLCQAVKDGKQKDIHKWKNATEKEVLKAMQEDKVGCDNPGCKKTESFLGEFKRCSKCKKSVYCGRDCQVKHWNIHKTNCK